MFLSPRVEISVSLQTIQGYSLQLCLNKISQCMYIVKVHMRMVPVPIQYTCETKQCHDKSLNAHSSTGLCKHSNIECIKLVHLLMNTALCYHISLNVQLPYICAQCHGPLPSHFCLLLDRLSVCGLYDISPRTHITTK